MKKTISLLLALALTLALSCPALAVTLPELTYDLSCEGAAAHTLPGGGIENALEYVQTGDEITVYYSISAAKSTNCGVSQDEIYYDHEFFELVPGSGKTESAFSDFYVTPQTHSDAPCYVFFDTITTHAYGAAQRIGSFTLRVIATGGESVIANTSCIAMQNLDEYPITTRDLWVGFGEWSKATFRVTLDANGGALPEGVSRVSSVNTEKGETLTLPAPTKLFYTFDYWTDGVETYDAGEEYAPAGHTTLTAHWSAVPAPAAPTGLGTVNASEPGAADGKITKTSAAMEFSGSAAGPFRACVGTSVGGLKAGTYYVRFMENAAANEPAGEAAAVTVEAWPLRAAPTGLSGSKASQPGAADGKISGTNAQMEYSLTETFASATRCTGSGITGLQAGTYYVRYVFDTATNKAASQAAAVKVEAWPLRDAPTGLGTVNASEPGAADGKITGTKTGMEYSLTPDFADAKPCGGTLSGLQAGTYYVRYVYDTANNKAPSRFAAVTVEAWPVRDAPAGLGTVKASRPGAADGKITGTKTGMEYSLTPDFADAKPCGGTLSGLQAGTYYVRYVFDAANNKAPSRFAAVTVEAWALRDAPTGLSGFKTSLPNAADGKITGTTTEMEYSLTPEFTDAKPCPGKEITGVKAGTYYVRYKFDTVNNKAASSYAAVTVAAGNAPAAPTGLSAAAASAPDKADGKILGVTALLEYSTKQDFSDAKSCPANEITGLAKGTYYVRVKAVPATNTPAGNYAVVTVPAVPTVPTGLLAMKTSLPDAKDGRITGVSSLMEYGTKADFSDAKACPDGELTGLGAGIYYVRIKAVPATNTPAGKAAAVEVPSGERPAAPTGLLALKTSLPDAKDGRITGVSSLMEYGTKADFSDAKVCPDGELTGLGAGIYYVRIKAVPGTNTPAGSAAAVTVPAGERPAAPTGLVAVRPTLYDRKDGKITGVSSLMEYSTTPTFDEAKDCPDGELTELGAGTYYVRVKAVPATNTPEGSAAEVKIPEGPIPASENPQTAGSSLSELAVEATVSEDYVATIGAVSDSAIKAAAKSGAGVVGIDLSTGDDAVEGVVLPGGMIGKVAAAVQENGKGGFALRFTSANLEFDMRALQSLAEQSKSGKLQINMQDTGTMALNDAQYAAVSGMSIYGGYSVTAVCGEKTIAEFGGGGIRISIPFNIPSGRYADGFSVYYVAPDGTVTEQETVYREGMLSFTVGHFSDYVIAYNEPIVFVDVVPGEYYDAPVSWAVKRGITNGTGNGKFSPSLSCTRAQIVTFLWRAAGEPEPQGDAGKFSDVPADEYYTKAVAWAIEQGITKGTTDRTFSPKDVCTRAQIVTFLWRAAGEPKPSGDAGKFSDVPAKEYYAEAVAWAIEQEITKGTSATQFSPKQSCTRAQAVTFLYRWSA